MQLPAGTILQTSFVIRELLERRPDGFSYLAHDQLLDAPVIIRECFPFDAQRNADMSVKIVDVERNILFYRGRYLREAQALARCKHDGIVRVFRIFEERNTVYSVLEFIDGTSLDEFLFNRVQPIQQAELDGLCTRILAALECLHKENRLLRQVNPLDIIVRQRDSAPVLMYLGASRLIGVDAGHIPHLTCYSPSHPPELFEASGGQEGPWTDIYGLAAILYRAILGTDIPDISDRVLADKACHLSGVVPSGRYRPSFLKAIDWGLEIWPRNRPQDLDVWRRMLLPDIAVTRDGAVRAVGAKIFISYRRVDSLRLVERIFERVATEVGREEVFFDMDSIPTGADFRKHIEVRLAQSAVVLAIIGQHWLRPTSFLKRSLSRSAMVDHVVDEIELAFSLGVPILPILIDGAKMPHERDLPVSIRRITHLNALSMRTGVEFDRDLDNLLETAKAFRVSNAGEDSKFGKPRLPTGD